MNHAQFWGGGGAALYEIDQSLRFNAADSFSFRRTPTSNSTSQKKFTFSVWSKRGVIAAGTTSNTGRQSIAYTGLSSGSGNLFSLEWRDDEVACLFNGAGTIWPQTVAKFRDPSAWYHIVVAVDTDQTTTADRCKIYVNGVQQTLTGTFPGAGFAVTNGSATGTIHSVGEVGNLRSNQYLAEMYYINDQQLAPTDFGELNNDGVWVPREYTGTFTGTNSYYLTFDSAATNGIGHDHSGNSNNFTTTNFTTSGTGTDVFSDTPTTNWCTLNPITQENGNPPQNGNLEVRNTASDGSCLGTIILEAGKKYYFEGTFVIAAGAGSQAALGITSTLFMDAFRKVGSAAGDFGFDFWGTAGTPQAKDEGTLTTFGTIPNNGDVCGLAIDLENGRLFAHKANSYYNSGDPAAGTGAVITGIPTDRNYLIHVSQDSGATNRTEWVLNFGQRAFTYTAPTGFNTALNTSGLTAPTIKDGSDHFNTVLWTGNSTDDRDITGVGFNPDLTWLKERGGANQHELYDAVRGATIRLQSNASAAEDTVTNNLKSFITDGFRLGTAGSVNNTNDTYVAWNWLAGNSTQTLATGSQSATVSVNATAGFSIATYTGTTSAYTVAHGLGVAPKMYINKGRDTATAWWVFHEDIGPTAGVRLDGTGAEVTATSLWNDTSPTSTVCHFGAGAASADPFIMYAFAEVESYSRISSYIGNGNADGPFVYCGFKPAFVLIKSSSAASTNWAMLDNTRSESNLINRQLFANLTNAEFASHAFGDFTANGFKIRDNSSGLQGNYNTNGATYVFAAFAEHPFGGAGVSPVTAR